MGRKESNQALQTKHSTSAKANRINTQVIYRIYRCTTTSDQWPLGLSISNDRCRIRKWASPAGTYVYAKAKTVNVNKCLKPFFLEQHINILNRVTL